MFFDREKLKENPRRKFCFRFTSGAVLGLMVIFSCPEDVWSANDGLEKGDLPSISSSLSLEKTSWADIDGTNTSFRYTEYSAGLAWRRFLLLDVDYRDYEWQEGADFTGTPGTDPWETLTRIAPGLQYYRKFDERWAIWPKLSAIAGFEDGISSKSWTYNPQVVGLYTTEQKISFYGGLGVLYHSVDSVVYPVLGVAWNTKKKRGLSGAVGVPEAMVRYGFNERVALKIDFQFDTRFYQIDGVSTERYIKIEDILTGFKVEYELGKGLVLSLGGRFYFGQELTVYGHDENELRSNDLDGSWSGLLGVGYRF